MIWNYLKVGWRTLRRNLLHTTISVVGLAVATATCLLIGMYVQDELSHDIFHPDADRIAALAVENALVEGRGADLSAPYALRDVVATEVPGLQHVTRTRKAFATVRRPGQEDPASNRREVLVVDSSFFDVLSGFRVRGEASARALDAPNEILITPSVAETVFGNREPLGNALTVDIAGPSRPRGEARSRQYTVAGVVEVPSNSTVTFDLLVPEASTPPADDPWGAFQYRIYGRAGDEVDMDRLGDTVEAAVSSSAGDDLVGDVRAIPLPELYFSNAYSPPREGFKGRPQYLYFFGTVAFLILLVASINYVNLVTAQGEQRAREVGIRKTVGARGRQIAGQFLCETALLSLLALGLGLALVYAFLPAFNAAFRADIDLTTAWHQWTLVRAAGLILLVPLLASVYPALILSGFRPSRILRGTSTTTSRSGGWLRRGLVVAQFAVSAGLILGTVVIYQQLNYVQAKDLGFDGEQVVAVDLGDLSRTRSEAIRRQVASHPDVRRATLSDAVPGDPGIFRRGLAPNALSPDAQVEGSETIDRVYFNKVDTNYVETLGLNITAGRPFDALDPAERRRGCILNEAAVRILGWTPPTALGRPVRFSGRERTVIGVVENFHVTSLRRTIPPVALALRPRGKPAERSLPTNDVLAARLEPTGPQAAMDHIQTAMREVAPQCPFNYTFLDDQFDQMYRSAERLGRIFTGFAGIAVILACMGLFGLVAYSAQRRSQEFGIRKALGASTADILGQLSGEYALLLGIAFLVGTPVAYLGVQRWLQAFAYRTDIGIGTYAATGGIVLLVAGASMSYHAVRAARTDPAPAIRAE